MPKADQLVLRPVQWTILTQSNAAEKFAKLGTPNPTYFALPLTGYQNYQMNQADLMALLQQYNKIITIYENQ